MHGWEIAGHPFLKPHFNNANLSFVFVSQAAAFGDPAAGLATTIFHNDVIQKITKEIIVHKSNQNAKDSTSIQPRETPTIGLLVPASRMAVTADPPTKDSSHEGTETTP